MNNDLYIHANGLIERFKQEAEAAIARRDWEVANAWYNAISIVKEPETNVEILKQSPTAKLPPAVRTMRCNDGKQE